LTIESRLADKSYSACQARQAKFLKSNLNKVPFGASEDIGAYEYGSAPPVIPNLTGIVTYGGKLVTSGGKLQK